MRIKKIDKEVFVTAKWAHLNKNSRIDQYYYEVYGEVDFSVEKMLVTEIVTLDDTEWYDFRNGLLEDRDWLAGKGGTNSTFELSEEREKEVTEYWQMTPEEREQWNAQSYRVGLIVERENSHMRVAVDPQGYDYARYVGIDVDIVRS